MFRLRRYVRPTVSAVIIFGTVALAAACGTQSTANRSTTDPRSSSTIRESADVSTSTLQPSTTQPPTTQAPTTQPPTTQPPTTQAPTTQPSTTQPPTTQAPTTQPPTTAATMTYEFPLAVGDEANYARDHHDYPAADIFATCGSDYLAPIDGTISEVSLVDTWDPDVDDPATRGGLSVTLVGVDGVRYYASHLSEVPMTTVAGAQVAAGEVLGHVGETGNAAGTGCHVHFGISPACGEGDWQVRRGVIWPWPYLDSWRKGSNKSPAQEISQHPC